MTSFHSNNYSVSTPDKTSHRKTASDEDRFAFSPRQLSEKSFLLTEATTNYSSEIDNDDDYSSASSVDEYESTFEDYASNVLFLLGSILFVWLGIWDVLDDDFGWGDDDDGSDDDAYNGPAIKVIGTMLSDPYVALSALASLMYVFDGCFQIAKLFCHGKATNDSKTINGDELVMRCQYALLEENTEESVSDNSSNDGNCLGQQSVSFWNKHGKFITSFLVGSTFGIGAFLDLVSGLIVDWDEKTSDMFDMIAVHLFLINALILTAPIFSSACYRPNRMYKPTECGDSESLEYIGDLLFLAGSLIDVMCSYINLDSSASISDWFFLLSDVLWLIDAIFYIAADWIAFREDEYDRNFIVHLQDFSESTRSSGISMKTNQNAINRVTQR